MRSILQFPTMWAFFTVEPLHKEQVGQVLLVRYIEVLRFHINLSYYVHQQIERCLLLLREVPVSVNLVFPRERSYLINKP